MVRCVYRKGFRCFCLVTNYLLWVSFHYAGLSWTSKLVLTNDYLNISELEGNHARNSNWKLRISSIYLIRNKPLILSLSVWINPLISVIYTGTKEIKFVRLGTNYQYNFFASGITAATLLVLFWVFGDR